jgi:hypothetical protein
MGAANAAPGKCGHIDALSQYNMAMGDEVTFRDFAAAVMQGDMDGASAVLERLLAVDDAVARAASAHFHAQMATGQAFMMKAMGMRTVVEARDEPGLRALLEECFALDADTAAAAARAVLSRYPSG